MLFRSLKSAEDDLRASESDGRRGLLIGISSGAVGGFLLGLLLAKLGILPVALAHAALWGMFLGMLIGGLGGGLYGIGLPSLSLNQLEKLWRQGNVLITAEVEGAQCVVQVEQIFRRHHALVATS